jgi:hypothetical protein
MKLRARNNYKISFKLYVTKYLERHDNNISMAARRFKLTRKTVRSWKKNKEKYLRASKKVTRSRLIETRRSFFPLMENALNDEIIELRNRGVNVSGELITIRAKVLASQFGYEFKGSNGWLSNFLSS